MTHPSVNSIVERKWTPEQFWEYLEAFVGEWEADTIKDAMEGFGLTIASATIISELQAQNERKDRLIEAHRQQIIDAGEIMKHWQDRALTAESSLSRIKAETIEECAKVALDGFGFIDMESITSYELVFVEAQKQIASTIRSLGSTGEAEKTAESGNPAPTRERD